MFKPFYIHRFREPGKLPNRVPRAFTAMVSPSDDPAKVKIQATFCSPKDQFCRKDGRKYAAEASVVELNKRELPRMMAALAHVCEFQQDKEQDWYYVLKYIV